MTKTIALARKLAESGKKEADNTDYWNQYYHNRVCSTQPCPFAQYVATLVEPGKTLVDLECGNGRDSLYFTQQGLQVVGIDLSPTAIELLRAQQVPNAQFVCGAFISNPAHTPGRYDYAYSCFTIHAINPKQETMLLQSMYQALKSGGGGKLLIEVRSIHDPLYGKGQPVERNAYFYDNHYRRFIVLEELVQSLEQCGYRVECAKEQTGFAPYGNDNPPLSGWWLYGHRGGPCPDTGGVP